MYCGKCGRELPDSTGFCPSCGEPASGLPASEPVSVGNWFLTMLLAVIPIAYVVMIFVWAFGNSNPSKKNWARASLIWVLVGILAAGLVVFAITGGLALLGLREKASGADNIIASSQAEKDDSADSSFALPSSSVETNHSAVTVPASAPYDEIPAEPDDGFIFPNSDTELLDQRDVRRLSDSDLRYAINEIYARHGYIFHKNELNEYFGQFDWYTPEIPADEFSAGDCFNQIEKQNWNLLVNERNSRPAAYENESEDWVYATLASSGDKSAEALVLRELTENGSWSEYFDGKNSDIWLKEYPTKSCRVRQKTTITTGREFELFITNNANAYRSRTGETGQNMTAYDMAVEEYSQNRLDHMYSELKWLGEYPVFDSSVELINGNSWYVYSGYNSGQGIQDCFWIFFFIDESQETAVEVSFEYVLYSGATLADTDFFNEWYLNLSESLLIR